MLNLTKILLPVYLREATKYLSVCGVLNYYLKRNSNILPIVSKKTANLGKLYFLPNIHKRLSSVPSRPVISNCDTPTEKFPEYLDHILKPVTLESWPYIKDSGNILMNLKHLGQITDGAILVTADVVGLYPNIPHKAVLEILRRRLIDTSEITPGILTEDTVQITEFVLKNSFLSSRGNLKDKNQVHQLILNLHLSLMTYFLYGLLEHRTGFFP